MLCQAIGVAFFNDNKSSLDKTIELLKKDVLEKMKEE